MDCNCINVEGKNCIQLVPIFSNLSYDEMMEVARITSDRTYEKGEMIYMAGDEGEKLYVIHKGKVKISRLSNTGKEQVIRVLGPGQFMGELSLFSPHPLTDNAEALEKTTVCIIDGFAIKKLMAKYPTIAIKVLEELSNRLEKAENLIENISLHGVERRLVDTLLSMANEQGEIILKMSRKDLASHLGMSRETLSRKLSAFQDLGFIQQIGHKKIIILDKEALEESVQN
ncbi:MAG: Crp/Fnr family transcriptional regulator [Caldicoprobacterales bacterium]|jgi:CRP-like cAMP-binding protein|nr:Crp/Fnr family transcriptional regulator [Clostridiales bacterium]